MGKQKDTRKWCIQGERPRAHRATRTEIWVCVCVERGSEMGVGLFLVHSESKSCPKKKSQGLYRPPTYAYKRGFSSHRLAPGVRKEKWGI